MIALQAGKAVDSAPGGSYTDIPYGYPPGSYGYAQEKRHILLQAAAIRLFYSDILQGALATDKETVHTYPILFLMR